MVMVLVFKVAMVIETLDYTLDFGQFTELIDWFFKPEFVVSFSCQSQTH